MEVVILAAGSRNAKSAAETLPRRNEFLKGKQLARNVINALYKGNYFTLPQLPAPAPEERRGQPQQENTAQQIIEHPERLVKVYPNPANNYVAFEMKGESDVYITVYDLYSRKLEEFQLKAGEAKQINTQSWVSGVYLWRATNKKDPNSKGKLSIIRW